MTIRPSVAAAALFFSLVAATARADVQLPSLFGDHMVLQRDHTVRIWGWADAGEKVSITAPGATATATADNAGKWSASLDKLAASSTSIELTIAGKNSITLHDVLVGDVWVCSGQSNMEFGLSMDRSAKESVPAADNPQIRLFLVTRAAVSTPQEHLPTNTNLLQDHWVLCTPKNIIDVGGWGGFSAAGYFFGQEIQHFTHQPVGLIGTYWGGTRAESWTSHAGLAAAPELHNALATIDKVLASPQELKDKYQTDLAAWETKDAEWKKSQLPAFQQAMKEWTQKAEEARAQNQSEPPRPQSTEPRRPADPLSSPGLPTSLNNGMIAPLQPFAIKGAIWYQGEANAGEPLTYRALFPAMITDWRAHWDEGDFPFLFVQLANFQAKSAEPQESNWAALREAQTMTLKLPNTGMATIIDIGNPKNIHPNDKTDVGHRLALAAEHVAYGANIVDSGPTFKSIRVEGNKITVTFDHVGDGLTIGEPPEAFGPSDTPTDKLAGFAIAGADHHFHWADATIQGDTITLSSPDVTGPVAVRYGWADSPTVNLYNKEGLPAVPFRTDDWPVGEAARKR